MLLIAERLKEFYKKLEKKPIPLKVIYRLKTTTNYLQLNIILIIVFKLRDPGQKLICPSPHKNALTYYLHLFSNFWKSIYNGKCKSLYD